MPVVCAGGTAPVREKEIEKKREKKMKESRESELSVLDRYTGTHDTRTYPHTGVEK